MSYMLDLDEYDEAVLEGELRRRKGARARGVCDYCNRHPFTSPCKERERHRDERIKKRECAPCTGSFQRRRDYSKPPEIRYSDEGLKPYTECNHCGMAGLLGWEGITHGAVLTEPIAPVEVDTAQPIG